MSPVDSEELAGELAGLGGPEVDACEREEARLRSHRALFGDGPERAKVGRYELIDKAGSGGLGSVWKARDPQLDRDVAIKLLRSDELRVNARARRQLLAEAAVMAGLRHPNVVRVYDVGEAEGELYVTMEFIEGETLRRWQRRDRSWRALLGAYLDAGAGLVAAHQAGLVHGDFKPDNVLVDAGNSVLVTDFAVTKVLVRAQVERALESLELDDATLGQRPTELDTAHRSIALIVGTPGYMAPEQLDGAVADARSDQFAFCVALWEALCDRRPFVGRHFGALRAAIAAGPPPVRKENCGPQQRRVLELLRRGLAEDPEQRYPDLQALLDELQRLGTRRRRWTITAGAAALVASGFVAALPLGLLDRPASSGPTSQCPQLAAAVEQTWTPQRRAALAELFASADWSTEAWRRIEPRVDAWTRQWTDARASLCERHEHGELSDQDYHESMACLDRNLASFDALIETLSSSSAATLLEADKAVSSLPAVADCRELERRSWEQAMLFSSRDPDQLARYEGLRSELERVRYQLELSDHAGALARVEDIVADAEAIGWDAGRAQAIGFRSAARHAIGQLDDAVLDARAALTLARRLRLDEVEALALATLSRTAINRGEFELAKQWLDLHEAVSLAAEQPRWRMTQRNNLGLYLQAQTDYEGAERAFRDALSLAEAHPEDEAMQQAKLVTLTGLADIQVLMHRPELALANCEQALALGEARLGPEHPLLGIVYNGLAGAHHGLGNKEAALDNMIRAHATTLATRGQDSVFAVIQGTNIAQLLERLGRCGEARQWIEQSATAARKVYPPTAPDLAQVIALQGALCHAQVPDALVHLDEAVALLDANEAMRGSTVAASVLGKRGDVRMARGLEAEGLADLERAVAIAEARFTPHHYELHKLRALRALARHQRELAGAVASLQASAAEIDGKLHPELAERLRVALAEHSELD